MSNAKESKILLQKLILSFTKIHLHPVIIIAFSARFLFSLLLGYTRQMHSLRINARLVPGVDMLVGDERCQVSGGRK